MNSRQCPEHPILIVDDEQYIVQNLAGILAANGFDHVITCREGDRVIPILEQENIELVLLDLIMPAPSGRDLLPLIRERFPDIPVVVITGSTEVDTAVDCMKLGVFDYLVKAIEESKLIATVARAVEFRDLRRENLSLKRHLVERKIEHPEALGETIIADEVTRSVYLYLESIAPGSQTVLITGETGTGKELVAKAIHTLSSRSGKFVPVNAAGLDDNLFSDTLFGHVREAFTGANHDRKGLISVAGKGTLFLDEIGDLSPRSQIALLRLLETREYFPLGSDLPQRSDARIVVASNRDIASMATDGLYRKDLYYRLRTHQVHVPPLRERPNETRLLFSHFVAEAGREYRKTIRGIAEDSFACLSRYSFPGNVRELRSIAYEAVGRNSTGTIDGVDVRPSLRDGQPGSAPVPGSPIVIPDSGFPTIRTATEFLISEALRRTHGHQAHAAAMLGISPPALSRRLKSRS